MPKNNNFESRHPNLLFVFPDQLGAKYIGCYGNRDISTPNIDSFAKQSVLFEQAYTVSPLCTPYRGALFTGRYPCQTGITENGYRIPRSEVTLPQLLNEAGYRTAYVGKWHLSGPPGGNRWVPFEERGGFKEFTGWESHHVDHWKGLIWEDDSDQPIEMLGHETDALTDIACQKLDELKESPFCLFVAYQAPHPPCSPPSEFLELYTGKNLSIRPNVTDEGLQYYHPEWGCDYDMRTFIDRYYGEISHIDHAFGRLLDKVDELGLRDDTIVIFTSDHGEMMGSHGRYGKYILFEEAVHVPLVIRHPQGPEGVRTDALFSTVDFMPTILDLCGVPKASTAEGISYGALVKGEDQKKREFLYMHYGDLCIRKGPFKLIVEGFNPDSPTVLYDLEKDPYELSNLIECPEYGDIICELQNKLDGWVKDVMTRTGDKEEAAKPSPALK